MIFLSIEKVFKKISEDQFKCTALLFFSTFLRKRCHILLSYNFMSHVSPKWNIYLPHYFAKFEYVLTFVLGLVLMYFGS